MQHIVFLSGYNEYALDTLAQFVENPEVPWTWANCVNTSETCFPKSKNESTQYALGTCVIFCSISRKSKFAMHFKHLSGQTQQLVFLSG